MDPDEILLETEVAMQKAVDYVLHEMSTVRTGKASPSLVELIDIHEGFSIITDKVQTEHKAKLLWGLSFLTFFLSAALDNLTTAIVMAALLRKLIVDELDESVPLVMKLLMTHVVLFQSSPKQ